MAGNAEDGDLTLSRKIFFTTLVAQVFFFFFSKYVQDPLYNRAYPFLIFSLSIFIIFMGFKALLL